MGKKKYNLKKKSLRENAEFDMMEGGDEPLLEAKIKNKPMIISSKKAKKKAKKSFLKASSLNKALNTMDTMEDVVQQKGKILWEFARFCQILQESVRFSKIMQHLKTH